MILNLFKFLHTIHILTLKHAIFKLQPEHTKVSQESSNQHFIFSYLQKNISVRFHFYHFQPNLRYLFINLLMNDYNYPIQILNLM